MTTNTDPVRALIEHLRYEGHQRGPTYVGAALRNCADELEAALAQQPAAPSGAAASAEPAVWVAADTLNSPHPACISSLAYMSQLDRERGREYVPLYTAPQQPAAVDEAPTWSRQQPTVPGIYGIRGFNLCRPASEQFEAVVVVREHGGELVCNLHESTSEDDLESWAPICDLDPDFEWRVFVPGWQQQGGRADG